MRFEGLSGEYLNKKRSRSEIWFAIVLGALTFLVALLFFFNLTISVCQVDGESMLPTLNDYDTVLMQKHFGSLERGDIVTISGMSSKLIIKRVIGLEGDKLVFKQDDANPHRVELYRDMGSGYEKLHELSYIKEGMNTTGWGIDAEKRFQLAYTLAPQNTPISGFSEYAIEIRAGECFVLGDNRNDSSDSRYYGAGKIENVRGKLAYKVKKHSILEKILLFVYRE